VMFFGRPFGEPTLFRIASAYESATHHRMPPPDFGPVRDASEPGQRSGPATSRR
jgi:hypothetical protein